MPRRLFEEIDNWAGGINTAANADALPAGVSPRGLNSALTNISPDPPRALAMKRKGGLPALTAPLALDPTIIGQHFLKQSDGTKSHVLLGNDGLLYVRATDGSVTSLDITALMTPTNDHLPEFAVANDLLFVTIGDDAFKWDGAGASAFGIVAPENPAILTPVAGAMTAGDYDIFVTFYNENTGTESGRSEVSSITLSGAEGIEVTQGGGTIDSQVTHWFVYIRQRSRGPNYYRAIAGTTPASDATGGFPIATAAVTLDITEAQLDAFRTLGPDENANQPPPTGAASPTWFQSRMFVHDGSSIYWSDVEQPEQFNLVSNKEPVNPDDGDEIVALYADHDELLVMKTKATYALRGSGPTSWEIEMVSPEIGTVNRQCIVSSSGFTFWWDRVHGPVRYAGGSAPQPIGTPDIGPTIDPSLLASAELWRMVAVADNNPERKRLMWAVPELGQTRNTLILPYSLTLNVWESSQWNPFDVASMAIAEDADSTPWVFIGGYSGRLWQWWNATNDGVPTTAEHTGRVTAATDSTLTVEVEDDTGLWVSPAWVVDELKELYVYAISSDGLDVQRKRITANTADTLTIDGTWGSNPNSTFTFVVGGIDFQWDTPWMLGGAPFHKKRYEFLFIQASSPDSGVPVSIDVFFTYDLLNVAKAKTLELLGSVVYDSAVYDVDRYASAVLDDTRERMSARGKAWRARVRNIYPDQELTLLKVAMQSVMGNTRS